jgi:hypothetical protein
MFIRKRISKGRAYYAVVESFTPEGGGLPRTRQLAALGTRPTIAAALAHFDQQDRANAPGKAARHERRRLLQQLAAEFETD